MSEIDRSQSQSARQPLRVSVVIPIYMGAMTIERLMEELEPYTRPSATPNGAQYSVMEVLLVHDCGPDRSDLVLETLSKKHPFVRPIWLSRNFGQHAATMAGMASATGDWVITMDEDGQQDPASIPAMLETAIGQGLQVVYAKPLNPPPHGVFRNTASRLAKFIASRLTGRNQDIRYNSYRVVDGEVARTLAAYCGNGVYLDVGLSWIAGRVGHCPVTLRREMDRPSGYSYRKLFAHFWNMILTSGTAPLRLITLTGAICVLVAFSISVWALYGKLTHGTTVPGWTSLLIVVSFFSGATLMSLGVIAEYLAVTTGIAMGKPLYVVSTKPSRPLSKTE